MIDCASAKGLLSPFLDRELAQADRGQVESHLKDCGPCRGELESLKGVCALVSALPKRTPPSGFLSRLSARRAAPPKPLPAPPRRGLAFAAAALVIGLLGAGASRLGTPTGASAPPEPSDLAAKQDSQPSFVPATPLHREINAPGGPLDAGPEAPKNMAAAEPSKPLPRRDEEITGVVREDDGTRPPSGGGYRAGPAGAPPPSIWEPVNQEQMAETLRRIQTLRSMMAAPEKTPIPLEGSTAPLLSRPRSERSAKGAPLAAEACSDPAATAAESCPKDAPPPSPPGEWSGPFGGANDPGGRAVSDQQSWAKVWSMLSTTPAPEVDFKNSQVLAVFLGPRPTGGYRVEIMDAKETEKALVVSFREIPPPSGKAPPPEKTAPYALRVVPRTGLPARFEKVSP